jgi:heterotetrameric sarcosine oxidase gamma subunit
MTHALFERFARPQHPPRADIVVRDWPVVRLVHFALTAASRTAFAAQMTVAGHDLPAPGMVCGDDTLRILAIAPAQFWVLATDAPKGDAVIGFSDRATDLTGSRLFLDLQGRGCAALLSQLAPFDFGRHSFATGRVVDTIADGMPVMIARLSGADRFIIATPASFSGTLRHRIARMLQ